MGTWVQRSGSHFTIVINGKVSSCNTETARQLHDNLDIALKLPAPQPRVTSGEQPCTTPPSTQL